MSIDLAQLPNWPRMLGRNEAAAYLGVSVDTFDLEVKDGIWPPPFRRGAGGGKLTWDRLLLDSIASQLCGIVLPSVVTVAAVECDAVAEVDMAAMLKASIENGATKDARH